MSKEGVEILVIGGGITGAGVARDAAMRGLSVGLVERGDFASGTSSRSSKLIHSGLRYLEQGEVGLVLEAARERRTLTRIAPHLAMRSRLVLPVHGRSKAGLMKLRAGLWAWEKMAKIEERDRHEIWSPDESVERVAGLEPNKLQGSAVYTEFITDDARLTLETIKSAKRNGAQIVNYAPAAEIETTSGKDLQVTIEDRIHGGTSTVRAGVVVNAAGPWVDAVRKMGGDAKKRMRLTKGIHLVVPRERLPVDDIVVMRAADRRMLFAVPLEDFVWLGTTDTDYPDAVERPQITRADVDYILDATAQSWPEAKLGDSDVYGAWAGVRPLVHQEGKSPSEISRKDEITVEPNGVLTIAGGKLTTYRQMAENVVDQALTRLGRTAADCRTAEVPLVDADEAVQMARVKLSDEDLTHAIEQECALDVTDVLERRTRANLFARGNGGDDAERVAAQLAARLGWNGERESAAIATYRERIAEDVAWKENAR